MAERKLNVHLNMLNNEIQNVKFQSLAAAPAAPKEAQFWYNSSDKTPYFYDGVSSKPFYGEYHLPIATASTLGGVQIGSNININTSTGTISVNDTSNTQTGVIRVATDAEATAGTAELLAVNPKQLANGLSDKITLKSLSGANHINYVNTTGVIGVENGYSIPTNTQVGLIDTSLQPGDVVNNVTSTATNVPLSANMGKELQDEIDNLKARGRYLSNWNAQTGLPTSDPTISPYPYKTGDYFIVTNVGAGDNYRPSGTSYTKGVASTVKETQEVHDNDTYIFDGTNWILQANAQRTVTFSSLAGDAYDNTNLAGHLNNKVTINTAITGATKCKITYDAKGLVTKGEDMVAGDITAALGFTPMDSVTTIDDLLPSQTGNTGKALMTNGTNSYWGIPTQKIKQNNPDLTPSGGVVTWTIANTINDADCVCSIKEVATGEEVYAQVTYSASNIVIKMNSSATITAGTYRAVIIG